MRRFLLAACCLVPLLPGAVAAAANFDGRWVVDVTTEVGPCEKTYQGTVTVAGGEIVQTDGATAAGFIEANGAAWARFSRDGQTARAQGKFSGASASGAWSSSTAYCGGHWRARKVSASG